MEESNFIYYRRRSAEERTAAERASCIQAAQGHRQMADHYAVLAARSADPTAAEQPTIAAFD